jgi:hypothetical protein
MKISFPGILVIVILFCYSCSQSGNKVELISAEADRKIDVMVDGKLFTSYIWPENVYKPVLYPVLASSGTEVTRGFPLKPREGERNDHIHQVGIWLTYGNVNGVDYWGTGYTGSREPDKGIIKHESFEIVPGEGDEGILKTRESWINPYGKVILAGKSEHHFIAGKDRRIIDWLNTLTAADTAVLFGDTKEGMFGIRVARQLELPLDERVVFLDAEGNPLKERRSAMEGATGNYHSSEGINGEAVWGTRARWMALDGYIGEEPVSVIICDHPDNPAYPTYWHARGYGLFAANPFGWKDFTGGAEVLGFSVEKGESVTFRYRVIIASGSHLADNEINTIYDDFAGRYRKQ